VLIVRSSSSGTENATLNLCGLFGGLCCYGYGTLGHCIGMVALSAMAQAEEGQQSQEKCSCNGSYYSSCESPTGVAWFMRS
jgi:hypothetical protein